MFATGTTTWLLAVRPLSFNCYVLHLIIFECLDMEFQLFSLPLDACHNMAWRVSGDKRVTDNSADVMDRGHNFMLPSDPFLDQQSRENQASTLNVLEHVSLPAHESRGLCGFFGAGYIVSFQEVCVVSRTEHFAPTVFAIPASRDHVMC